MKRHRKTILFIILLLITTACLPREGDDDLSNDNENVTLEFWTFWGSETRRPIIEKIIDDYNASQDNITVKHTFLPWGDVWTKNLAAISAGNAPDIIVNDINSVANRAENGQVEDITDYVVKDNLEETLFPELFETVKYDDKIYGLPFVTDTRLLFYNKRMFADAGLDTNSPPTTWEELEEYAIKLDKVENDRYVEVGFYPLWGSFGADAWMLNADEGVGYYDDQEQPRVDSERKVEALQWLSDYRERIGGDAVNMFESEFGSQQANPFISEKVAMYVDVATFYTQLRDYGEDLDYGVVEIPEIESGSGHYSVGGGFVVEIPKGSKHIEEAYDFIKYLSGYDAQKYWAIKNFDNVANIQASMDAGKDDELDEKGKEVYNYAVENLKVTKLSPLPIWATDTNNLVNPNIDAVLLEGRNAQEELQKAQKKLEGIAR